MHPADKLGRSRSPKMLSIPLVYLASLPSRTNGTIFLYYNIVGRVHILHMRMRKIVSRKVVQRSPFWLETAFCVGETARCIKHDR